MASSLKDVALKANTSITTVSLVLNNKPVRVSKEKKKQILQAAGELDFKPNETAKSLVMKRTMTIGIIVPDIRNLFFAELVRYIGIKLKKFNYSLLLCNSDNIADEDINQMELLRAKSVDGILAIFSDTTAEKFENEISKIVNDNIPLVIMDRHIENTNLPYVGIDDRKGGYIATRYLIENNHRNIACITGPKYSVSSNMRFLGYCDAMNEFNIPINKKYIFHGNFEFYNGEALGKEILKIPEITAVFAENDMMALGVYRSFSLAGKRVGKDISIMGFDDIVFSSMLDIPLTTMNQNIESVADKAVQLLMSIIRKEPIKDTEKLLEPTLVVRSSVCKL